MNVELTRAYIITLLFRPEVVVVSGTSVILKPLATVTCVVEVPSGRV